MLKLYTKSGCPKCRMTKRLLDEEGADYQLVAVDEDRAAMDELLTLNIRSVPVVATEDMAPADYVTGFAPDALKALVRKGA